MDLAKPHVLPAQGAAWQPVTFDGVAAFAHASWYRLLLVAGLVAAILGATAVWFVRTAWLPPLRRAIVSLPAQAEIRAGRLFWPVPGRVTLADTPFLGVAVATDGVAIPVLGGDLQIVFMADALRVTSLFGYRDFEYPQNARIPLGRTEVEAWRGAWEPYMMPGLAVLVAGGAFTGWLVLGALLALPLRVYAFLLDRSLTLGGAWRLAVAALLPGALMVAVVLAVYILRRVSLAELLLGHALQVLVGAAYLLVAPTRLPPDEADGYGAALGFGSRTNPFSTGDDSEPRPDTRNPWASVSSRPADTRPSGGARPEPPAADAAADDEPPLNPS